MPRRKHVDRPIKVTAYLPESLHSRLTLYLYSPIQGVTPHGALSKFLEERTREFFERMDQGRAAAHAERPPSLDEAES